MKKTNRLSLMSLLVSLALILHVVENLLPVPYVAPGVKLGLANIVSLITIVLFGFKEAIIVVILRTFLGSLLGGVPSSFLFSVTGGIFSTIVMYLFYRSTGGRFSLVGISVAGAAAHNVGQLLVASIVIENFGIYVYLPVLMVSAIITGIFIGFVSVYSIKLIENNVKL